MRLAATLNPAPFAALLLIAAATLTSTGHVAHGFYLAVTKIEPCGADDRRIIVLQALHAGRLRINSENTSIGELAGRLETIFRVRAERVVFVTAEADVPFSSIVELIDVASTQVDRIALLPTLEVLRHPHRDMCPVLVPMATHKRS